MEINYIRLIWSAKKPQLKMTDYISITGVSGIVVKESVKSIREVPN